MRRLLLFFALRIYCYASDVAFVTAVLSSRCRRRAEVSSFRSHRTRRRRQSSHGTCGGGDVMWCDMIWYGGSDDDGEWWLSGWLIHWFIDWLDGWIAVSWVIDSLVVYLFGYLVQFLNITSSTCSFVHFFIITFYGILDLIGSSMKVI